jgi:hypothetical protein
MMKNKKDNKICKICYDRGELVIYHSVTILFDHKVSSRLYFVSLILLIINNTSGHTILLCNKLHIQQNLHLMKEITTNFHLLWNVFYFTFHSNFVYIYI